MGPARAIPGVLHFSNHFWDEDAAGGAFLAALGFIVGWGGSIFADFQTGANFNLSPKELNVTISQIEGKEQTNYIFIAYEKFQSVKWIRIDFCDPDGGCTKNCENLKINT